MKDKIFNDYFKVSQTFDLVKSILTFAMLIFSIVQSVYSIIDEHKFMAIAALFIIIEYVLDLYQSEKFNIANEKKLNIFIDNTFGTKKVPCYSSGDYYNNEEIKNESVKMLANVHENSFFTSNIAEESKKYYLVVSTFFAALFFILIFLYGLNEIAAIILNFIITGSFCKKTFNYCSLSKKTSEIFKKCNDLCSKLQNDKELNFYPDVILLFVEYESIKYENKIVLSEKKFKKMNDDLSNKWKNIKGGYDIYKRYNE